MLIPLLSSAKQSKEENLLHALSQLDSHLEGDKLRIHEPIPGVSVGVYCM